MWFKQAKTFKLTTKIAYDADALASKLSQLEFRPCLPSLPASAGFFSPLHQEDAALVHAANGFLMFCLKIEEKLLPTIVIRQTLEEKIAEFESIDDKKMSAKDKRQLKDDVTQSLLPKAFSKISYVHAFIDTNNQLLIIDTTINSKLEKFMSLLSRVIDPLKFELFDISNVSAQLTRALREDSLPINFVIEKACVLVDPDNTSRVIRCQQQNLAAKPIQELMQEGCQVSQLALTWQDRVKFNLSHDLSIKSIRFEEKLIEAAKESHAETEGQLFDADMIIMTETLSAMWQEIAGLFVLEKAKIKREAVTA